MLNFIFGTMRSGKSEELIRLYNNNYYNDRLSIVIKPNIDTRDGVGVVASRNGGKVLANIILNEDHSILIKIAVYLEEIKRTLSEIDDIFIDEAQFLTEEQIYELIQLSEECRVHCFALKNNSDGELFAASALLMTYSDYFREIECICSCGRKATQNLRLDAKGNPIFFAGEISIGYNYVQKCTRCFLSAKLDDEFSTLK